MKQLLFVVSTMLILLTTGSVFGASITIIPTGSDTFAIQGSGLDHVTALDITIGYDSTLLANPGVTSGDLVAGGMLARNLCQPGMARLGIIHPKPDGVSGSGTIATLRFTRKGGTGGVLFLNASLVGANGKIASASLNEPGPSMASHDR